MENLRKNYPDIPFSRSDLSEDPFAQLQKWLDDAIKDCPVDPTAMTLATATADGIPSTRTVLLKKLSHKELTFYTHYNSKKGQEIAENFHVSATFYWRELSRQVSIRGTVEKISKEKSEAYFQKRPLASQIAAWASKQDEPLASRKILEEEYEKQKQRFEGKQAPLPPYWGGYQIIPIFFEFWQGRSHRLHDRFAYTLENEEWKISRLSP